MACRTLLLAVIAAVQATHEPPNILLILADDMGWNDLGAHGSEVPTPNIDALGYYGVHLTRHYSQPLCTPSRTALMTSKYPSRLGMQGAPITAGSPIGLPLSEKLFPQYMKELGYKTHMVGKWHLGSFRREYLPTYRGFDSHFGFWNGYIDHFSGAHLMKDDKNLGVVAGLDMHRDLVGAWNESSGDYITEKLTLEAERVIKNHGKHGGLMLVVTHAAPHTGNPGPTLLVRTPNGLGDDAQYIPDPGRRALADMVKELDDSVGRLTEALEKQGMLNNTIILFLADNGAPTIDLKFNFANHGSNWPLKGEKISLFEGGVRTVGAVWSSGFQQPGRIYDGLIHLVDWMPTLFSAAGGDVTKLQGVDGVDHWTALSQGPTYSGPAPRESLLVEITDGAEAVIQGHWKLIRGFPKNNRYAFADKYHGASGRGLKEYNESAVYDSPVATALRGLGQESSTLTTTDFLQVRTELMLDGACGERIEAGSGAEKLAPDCSTSYCLFDLSLDPCEMKNQAADNQQTVATLTALLDQHRNASVAKLQASTDSKSNPSCWSNYWIPWMDDDTLVSNQCKKSSPMPYFTMISPPTPVSTYPY